jgi:hypothetical protein
MAAGPDGEIRDDAAPSVAAQILAFPPLMELLLTDKGTALACAWVLTGGS